MGIDVTSKASTLVRQQYLVPKRSVNRLREMSRSEGISVDALVNRAIAAYMAEDGAPAQAAECAAAEALLAETHRHVRDAVTRIDASLAHIMRCKRALRDPDFRARIRQETEIWFRTHPSEAQTVTLLFEVPETNTP